MELGDAEALVQAMAAGLARQPDSEALDALYRALPRMVCKGKCASACGPISLSPLEKEHIKACGVRWVDGRVVASLPGGKTAASACSALDQTRLRCRAYEARPMICRIWGLAESLKCPWGCEPEGGHLDDVEAMRLLNLSMWHGGSAEGIEPARWERAAARPEYRVALAQLLAESIPVQEEPLLVQATIRVRPAE